jgi:predicted enzyme related to lactoylglutathione lyase
MNVYPLTKVKEFRLKLFPKDFYKVKDFYENTLGYPITDSWDGDKSKGAMFDTGVAIIELLTPKTDYVNLQGSNVALMVDDIWKLWDKLKNHPNIVMPLTERPWGDVSFRITDPEGFQITFFTPKKMK